MPLFSGSRTLFSTHYHELTENLLDHPRFSLHHMALIDATEESKTITFLYKLKGRRLWVQGVCPGVQLP